MNKEKRRIPTIVKFFLGILIIPIVGWILVCYTTYSAVCINLCHLNLGFLVTVLISIISILYIVYDDKKVIK